MTSLSSVELLKRDFAALGLQVEWVRHHSNIPQARRYFNNVVGIADLHSPWAAQDIKTWFLSLLEGEDGWFPVSNVLYAYPWRGANGRYLVHISVPARQFPATIDLTGDD